MKTIYGLTWDASDPNTDSYGSQIAYDLNGFVRYQNLLQPAGKRIHWWETKHPQGNAQGPHYGSKLLPQLPRNEKFHLLLDGTASPADSVGIKLVTYDQNQQLANESMSLTNHLSFELTNDEQDYEFSLVKFNNQQFVFKGLFIVPDEIWQLFTIKPRFEMAAIDLIPKDSVKKGTEGTMMIRNFNRVVDATPFATLPALQPNRIVWVTASWSASELEQKLADFKTDFDLQSVKLTAGDLVSQRLLNEMQQSDI
ncbi:accessory Sec system protein Asp3 [Fructilactobacillus cliffordii]|uniref:Accessory Sec system protein Asp3 n=1 Tax=Fructilactobacillus cliffordii TaxID=2940299 RepID=A0A9Q8ZUC2_9LACO|nr:accessory Sec system protein Asp3 [Fructilactobacillus cliffordii]USS88646.1 hypothetical protein M3M40_03860 [Fructilactobacillus cliffordii]